jgi:hypothetical protein
MTRSAMRRTTTDPNMEPISHGPRRRLLAAAALLLGARGGDDGTPRAAADGDAKARTATEKDFDPKGNFSAPTRVDNPWHPLAPGTQFVFEGRSNRGLGRLPHRVIMRGDPQRGTPVYMQGVAPKIGFGDTAKVLRYEKRRCVPVGCHENVLVVDETNPLDPGDGHQLKYHAGGVGNISVVPGRGGKEREVLELTRVQKLRPRTLAKINREALRFDRRAYRTVRKVWRGTERARPAR